MGKIKRHDILENSKRCYLVDRSDRLVAGYDWQVPDSSLGHFGERIQCPRPVRIPPDPALSGLHITVCSVITSRTGRSSVSSARSPMAWTISPSAATRSGDSRPSKVVAAQHIESRALSAQTGCRLCLCQCTRGHHAFQCAAFATRRGSTDSLSLACPASHSPHWSRPPSLSRPRPTGDWRLFSALSFRQAFPGGSAAGQGTGGTPPPI